MGGAQRVAGAIIHWGREGEAPTATAMHIPCRPRQLMVGPEASTTKHGSWQSSCNAWAHRAMAAYIAATKPWHSSAADVATSESSHARGSGSPIGPCCCMPAAVTVLYSEQLVTIEC